MRVGESAEQITADCAERATCDTTQEWHRACDGDLRREEGGR